MGKIIPFQNKNQSIEILTKSLLSKIKNGKFSPVSSYSKGIIRYLETAGVDDINAFLMSIASIVEALDWKYHTSSVPNPERDNAIEKIRNMPAHQALIASVDRVPELLRIRNQIYTQLFHDDRFLDKLYKLVPCNAGIKHTYLDVRLALLGKTGTLDDIKVVFHNPNIQVFLSQCLKIVVSRFGLLEQLLYMDLFSSFSLSKELTAEVVHNLLRQYNIKSAEDISTDAAFEVLTEKYLSTRFRNEELDFVGLYRLLILRHRLKKGYNDVCKTLIDIVDKTALDDILRALDESYYEIENEYITYTPEYSQETSEFHHDLYIALHDAEKFNYEIANNAVLFFSDDLASCPLGLLMLGSVYGMDEIPGSESSAFAVKGFLAASRVYSAKSLYEEALLCFKVALFNTITLFGVELKERLDMSQYKEITRKLNAYDNSINFFSKFRLISEYGFPMNQGVLNEIEIAKTELERERDSRSYHKIDAFYELLAKEDFTAIQSHVGVKDKGKFVLTGNELQILLKKIQEKSDIIQLLKTSNAKLDVLMYMNRAVYDKQSAILDAIMENQEANVHLISQITEKIIENLNKKYESYDKHVNTNTCQEFYYSCMGEKLWRQLDENTRKYLLRGQHLDVTTRYSPVDECGGNALAYALAIENEFRAKIITSYLAMGQPIKYVSQKDNITSITHDTRITFGTICHLIKETGRANKRDNALHPFYNYIVHHTLGQRIVFSLKEDLFKIDKYRNCAAHLSNYTRDLLEEFKALLFQQGFLKNYFEAIQIEQLEKL